LPWAYSNAFRDGAKCKHQATSICFPSYAFSVQSADGDPFEEIKSPCPEALVENLTTHVQKLLTSKIIPPTMQTLTGTYVFVDKSEQAEEGARSFLLLWLV
jgi:hypothetical protein